MLKWTSDKSKKLRNFAVTTVVPLFFAVLFGIWMFWPKNQFLGHNFDFFTKTWITFAIDGLRPSFGAHSEANSPFYELRKKYFLNSSPTSLLRGEIEFSSFLKFSFSNIVTDCSSTVQKILTDFGTLIYVLKTCKRRKKSKRSLWRYPHLNTGTHFTAVNKTVSCNHRLLHPTATFIGLQVAAYMAVTWPFLWIYCGV